MQPDVSPRSEETRSGVVERFGGTTIRVLVLFVLTIVLMAVTTALSWWDVTAGVNSSESYLAWVCSGSCLSYTDTGWYAAQGGVFGLTNALVLTSLALSVAALVSFLCSMFWPRAVTWTRRLGILASLLILAAPVYLLLALPGAVVSDWPWNSATWFFGSNGLSGTEAASWGGGIGWYLAFAAFILGLASAVSGYSTSRTFFAHGGQVLRLPDDTPDTPGAVVAQRRERTAKVVAILLVVTIMLVALAWVLPWWSIAGQSNPSRPFLSYFLVGISPGAGFEVYFASLQPPGVGVVFAATCGLLLASLGLAIRLAFRIRRSRLRAQDAILNIREGLLGSFLLLAAPILILEALPSQVASGGYVSNLAGFFGSSQGHVWGAGIGWYIAVAACPTFLVATVLAFSSSLHPPSPVPEEPAAGQGTAKPPTPSRESAHP